VRLLLDSHTFLWWVRDDRALTRRARAEIGDTVNECFLSHASIWEMAIKASLGKLKLPATVERFVVEHCDANSFRLLPIALPHIAAVEMLPFHHRDPFDRLLVAQARHEGMTLVSHDPSLKAYGVSVIR
jgi:PIN domain nuclease of toxin-antitoxin system